MRSRSKDHVQHSFATQSLTFTVLLLLVTGCYSTDATPVADQTRNVLAQLSRVMVQYSTAGGDLAEFNDLGEFLERSVAEGLVPAADARELANDGWGRPFHWKICRDQSQIEVSVISAGADGIRQSEGDDIRFTIDVSTKDTPRVIP